MRDKLRAFTAPTARIKAGIISDTMMRGMRSLRTTFLAGKERRSIIQIPDSKPKTPSGFLKDQDRIFQGIYGDQGVGIENAKKIVC